MAQSIITTFRETYVVFSSMFSHDSLISSLAQHPIGPYQSVVMLEVYGSAHYKKIQWSFLDELDIKDADEIRRSHPYGAIALTAYAVCCLYCIPHA